jgi:1,4-dihydroxy-2-naphthoate octaprenyltransferase
MDHIAHGLADGVAHATWQDWVGGARLRTLPLAVAPIAAAAGLAYGLHGAQAQGFSWLLCGLALAVALCLQIGVNYANDYSDGIRGTDAHRVGPARLTGSGRARPRQVRSAAFAFFALAAAAGIAALLLSGRWWLLAVGAAAIPAAWCYSGGKRPYGYAGGGELAVFLFFGLAATVGTVWLLSGRAPLAAWLAGSGMGSFAVAVLVINNTRDIATDRLAGKHTISVRIGERASRWRFVACVLLPFALPALYGEAFPGMRWLWLLQAPLLLLCALALRARHPRALVAVLGLTSLSALAYGLLLGAAFAGVV